MRGTLTLSLFIAFIFTFVMASNLLFASQAPGIDDLVYRRTSALSPSYRGQEHSMDLDPDTICFVQRGQAVFEVGRGYLVETPTRNARAVDRVSLLIFRNDHVWSWSLRFYVVGSNSPIYLDQVTQVSMPEVAFSMDQDEPEGPIPSSLTQTEIADLQPSFALFNEVMVDVSSLLQERDPFLSTDLTNSVPFSVVEVDSEGAHTWVILANEQTEVEMLSRVVLHTGIGGVTARNLTYFIGQRVSAQNNGGAAGVVRGEITAIRRVVDTGEIRVRIGNNPATFPINSARPHTAV